MEKNIKIKISNKLSIYGTLNKSARKSSKIIIFVHGFTGHINEHFLYNGARFFTENGFDTFRFSLYSFESDSRKLVNCTISEHIDDLNTVIEYFREKYSEIYGIGHSLGGYIVAHAKSENLNGAVLWEPSQEAKDMCKGLKYNKELGVYIENSNVDILVGKNFVESANTLSPIKKALSEFKKPIKIIGAELAGAKLAKDIYFAYANKPKALHTIKGSGHTFDEGDSEKELFAETLSFLKK